MDNLIKNAADIICRAKHVTAFTGAGISAESGIPPFRGPGGLWSKYDPGYLMIDYFLGNPLKSWELIRELFYENFGRAKPNLAHIALAKMEERGLLKTVITQNIDYLHQLAGSKNVYEYHGTYRYLRCVQCGYRLVAEETYLENLPPKCPECSGILKPDFVFFGEMIPEDAGRQGFIEAQKADVFLVIGSTGEVMPAAQIPHQAFMNGCIIIEINIQPSNFTNNITHIFLRGKASEVMSKLARYLEIEL